MSPAAAISSDRSGLGNWVRSAGRAQTPYPCVASCAACSIAHGRTLASRSSNTLAGSAMKAVVAALSGRRPRRANTSGRSPNNHGNRVISGRSSIVRGYARPVFEDVALVCCQRRR